MSKEDIYMRMGIFSFFNSEKVLKIYICKELFTLWSGLTIVKLYLAGESLQICSRMNGFREFLESIRHFLKVLNKSGGVLCNYLCLRLN